MPDDQDPFYTYQRYGDLSDAKNYQALRSVYTRTYNNYTKLCEKTFDRLRKDPRPLSGRQVAQLKNELGEKIVVLEDAFPANYSAQRHHRKGSFKHFRPQADHFAIPGPKEFYKYNTDMDAPDKTVCDLMKKGVMLLEQLNSQPDKQPFDHQQHVIHPDRTEQHDPDLIQVGATYFAPQQHANDFQPQNFDQTGTSLPPIQPEPTQHSYAHSRKLPSLRDLGFASNSPTYPQQLPSLHGLGIAHLRSPSDTTSQQQLYDTSERPAYTHRQQAQGPDRGR